VFFEQSRYGNLVGHLLGIEQFAVDAVEAVGADPTLGITDVLQGVAQVVDAALGEHHVVVQVLGQAFPQFHRVFVQVRRLVPQVVGTNDGGVARGVTAAQPAFFDHGHVGDAVLLGQVVGGRQTMPATADDDHVVDLLGVGVRHIRCQFSWWLRECLKRPKPE
jgi:hypothetical protein